MGEQEAGSGGFCWGGGGVVGHLAGTGLGRARSGWEPCPWDLAVLPSLVLVPLHTTPKAVETELNALYDVFLDASRRWQTKVRLGRFYGGRRARAAGWSGPMAACISRM